MTGLMMTIGILRRGTTCKEPKTSPSPGIFYRCMRISARSCIRNNGMCGGGRGGSM
ncbi:hypothetical protein BDR03DRAFT_964935 [Suillus americanus]|nr:hypothetical protein BDR03DRAFT_964935 [Suillus americanus]